MRRDGVYIGDVSNYQFQSGAILIDQLLYLFFPFARDVKTVPKVAVCFVACLLFNVDAHDGKGRQFVCFGFITPVTSTASFIECSALGAFHL